jgi:hypothetical protein
MAMERFGLDLGDVFVMTEFCSKLCGEVGTAFQTPPEKTDQQLGRGVEIRWRCRHDVAGVPCIGEDLLYDGEFVGIQSRGRSVG